MPVTTLNDLREHLQWAIELEHSTLPPYLCALYSIKPGTNSPAVAVITSVFIEEMLHMTLAANVLNAVGGAPVLDHAAFIPSYPAYLPHSANAFQVSLEPFSPAAIETFMKIERPEDSGAPSEDEGYDTIGQFYQAIEEGLQRLCEEMGEAQVFTGDPARQILPDTFRYSGSGRVIPVYDLASAVAAIDTRRCGTATATCSIPSGRKWRTTSDSWRLRAGVHSDAATRPSRARAASRSTSTGRRSTRCARIRGPRTFTGAAPSSPRWASSTSPTRICSATCIAPSTASAGAWPGRFR